MFFCFTGIETTELEGALICYNQSNNCSGSCVIVSPAQECCGSSESSIYVLGNDTCLDYTNLCGRCKELLHVAKHLSQICYTLQCIIVHVFMCNISDIAIIWLYITQKPRVHCMSMTETTRSLITYNDALFAALPMASPSPSPSPDPSSNSDQSTVIIASVVATVGFILLVLIVVIVALVCLRRSHKTENFEIPVGYLKRFVDS